MYNNYFEIGFITILLVLFATITDWVRGDRYSISEVLGLIFLCICSWTPVIQFIVLVYTCARIIEMTYRGIAKWLA